jgi:hypothetical protein
MKFCATCRAAHPRRTFATFSMVRDGTEHAEEQIAEHFLLSRRLAEAAMIMHFSRNGPVNELLVMTADGRSSFPKSPVFFPTSG